MEILFIGLAVVVVIVVWRLSYKQGFKEGYEKGCKDTRISYLAYQNQQTTHRRRVEGRRLDG